MDGISRYFFAELFRLIHLLTSEESEKSRITQMRFNPAKSVPDKISLAMCHLKDTAVPVTASREIAFLANHSERGLLRPQRRLAPEDPIASLATRMTPLEFPFQAAAGKDGPPPSHPKLPHRA